MGNLIRTLIVLWESVIGCPCLYSVRVKDDVVIFSNIWFLLFYWTMPAEFLFNRIYCIKFKRNWENLLICLPLVGEITPRHYVFSSTVLDKYVYLHKDYATFLVIKRCAVYGHSDRQHATEQWRIYYLELDAIKIYTDRC